MIPQFTPAVVNADYSRTSASEHHSVAGGDLTGQIISVLGYWRFNGNATSLSVGAVRDLSLETTTNCVLCVAFASSCDGGICKTYFATAGTGVLNQATRADAGFISATLSNVRFDAWDLNQDKRLDGGCVVVNAATLMTSY